MWNKELPVARGLDSLRTHGSRVQISSSAFIMKDTAVIAEIETTNGKHLEELIEVIDSSEKFDIMTTKDYDFTKGKHETVAVRIEPDDAGYKK